MKKSCLLILLACLMGTALFAQKKFVADAYGFVADAAFKKLIAERKYQLVGGFLPVDNDSVTHYARVVKGGKWGFINSKGQEVITPRFKAVDDFSNGLAMVHVTEKPLNEDGQYHTTYCFIDTLGKPAGGVYDAARPFKYGYASVNVGGKWGIIDAKGVAVVPLVYNGAYSLEHHFIVRQGDAFALFSQDGKALTGFIYTDLRYHMGLLMAFNGSTFCLLNPVSGQPVHDEWYHDNHFYSTTDGARGLCGDKGCCLVNAEGTVISGYYANIRGVWLNHVAVSNASGAGLLDSTGKEVIPCTYFRVDISNDGQLFIAYKKGGGAVYFNSEYKPVDFSAYAEVEKISNGLVAVRVNGKLGFADYTGRLVLAAQYDYSDLGFEADGLARVTVNQKQGLINRAGTVIAPLIYDYIYYNNGLHYATLGSNVALFDKNGAVLAPLYTSISAIKGSNGLLSVKKGGLNGVVDTTGKVVVPFDYKYINNTVYANGLIYVEKVGGASGYINVQGKVVIRVQYDSKRRDDEITAGMMPVIKDGKHYYADFYGNLLLIE
jgi:hypothetical protein